MSLSFLSRCNLHYHSLFTNCLVYVTLYVRRLIELIIQTYLLQYITSNKVDCIQGLFVDWAMRLTIHNMICKESQYNKSGIVDTFSVSSNGLNKWRFSNDIKHRHIVLTVVDIEMCLFFISYNVAVAPHVLLWTSLVIWYIYLTRLYENKRGLSTRSVSIQFPWITPVSGNKIYKKSDIGRIKGNWNIDV